MSPTSKGGYGGQGGLGYGGQGGSPTSKGYIYCYKVSMIFLYLQVKGRFTCSQCVNLKSALVMCRKGSTIDRDRIQRGLDRHLKCQKYVINNTVYMVFSKM